MLVFIINASEMMYISAIKCSLLNLYFIQAQIEKNDDIICLYPTKNQIMHLHNEKIIFKI